MKVNVKAAILSAFVLPGLGQIVNGKKLKGLVIIGIVNIFILVALALVMKGMGQIVISIKAGGSVDAAAVLEQVRQNTGGNRPLLAGFLVLWFYAVVDALFDRPKDG
jgi:TM2 domain-containing membrane protein YozV